MNTPDIAEFIAAWAALGLAADAPWGITQDCETHVRSLLARLGPGYRREGDCAIHETAVVEPGAVLKGAIIVGPEALVAAGAYLRGGVYLGHRCIVGPSCEVKSSFMLDGSKLAHFNFVGDSLLGHQVNVEAGAIIANYRNELDGAAIRIAWAGGVLDTGVNKFGALVGDGCKVGANAVIAPGALLRPGTRVPRLGLVDQYAQACPA
jgi:bifunctional N-acetylglucosamine-1-phosphate-uridyltransferase/glucosamine-1-phosphate-acetyltransferase GlmU-like protein